MQNEIRADKNGRENWAERIARVAKDTFGDEHPNIDKVISDSAERKKIAIATGVIDYFPDALIEVAKLSWTGNEKHNPGEPLHWSREKSADHADCLMRHFVDRGKIDTDRVRHSGKVAWRALAILQLEIEAARAKADDIVTVNVTLKPDPKEDTFKTYYPGAGNCARNREVVAGKPEGGAGGGGQLDPNWAFKGAGSGAPKFRASTLDIGQEVELDAPSGVLHCDFGKSFPNGTKGIIMSRGNGGDFAGVQFEKNGMVFSVEYKWLKPYKRTNQDDYDDYRKACLT